MIFKYWSFNGIKYDFDSIVENDLILIAEFEPKERKEPNEKEEKKQKQKNKITKDGKNVSRGFSAQKINAKPIIITIMVLILIALLFGVYSFLKNRKTEEKNVVEAPKVEYYSYTVQFGDTYYQIAQNEYQDRHFWPYLYNENKDLHNDPDVLEVNDNLRLPIISKSSKSYEEYVEYNREKVIDAFINSYNAYSDVNKKYRAIRTLESGEIVSEGFLNEIKDRIPQEDIEEAKKNYNK